MSEQRVRSELEARDRAAAESLAAAEALAAESTGADDAGDGVSAAAAAEEAPVPPEVATDVDVDAAARTFPDAGAEARERRRRRLLTEEEEAAADAAELQRLYREQAEEDELKGHTRVGRRARLTMRSTTKHDPAEAALRNARRLGRFEGAGDMWTGHTRVPQAASNSLKRHFQSRQRKGVPTRGGAAAETRATRHQVLDPRTMDILARWINAGVMDEVHGVVKAGKEASVFHAHASDAEPATAAVSASASDTSDAEAAAAAAREARGRAREEEARARGHVLSRWQLQEETRPVGLGPDRALKIFKTTLNEFSRRVNYVVGDHRYKELRVNAYSTRQLISLWAEKEMKNLIRLHRAGLPCPQPLMQKDHVLLMSFIGKRGWPAPQLRVVKLSPPRLRRCYRQTLRIVHGMYHRAQLVHADLSEFNLLLHRGRTWVIDVGQAVERRHPDADRLLRNDITNVSAFFAKRGLPVRDPLPGESGAEAEDGDSERSASASEEGAEGREREHEHKYEHEHEHEDEDEDQEPSQHTKPDCGPCAVAPVDSAVAWVLTEFPTDAAREEAMEEPPLAGGEDGRVASLCHSSSPEHGEPRAPFGMPAPRKVVGRFHDPPAWLDAYPEGYRPFIHPSPPLSAFQIGKTVVFMVTLMPFRLLFFTVCLILYSAIARIALIGWPSPDTPLRGARATFVDGLGRAVARAALFVMGFYWIRQRGRRDPRVRTVVSNHLSYLDILFHTAMFSPSFVAKSHVRRIPFIGFLARVFQCVFVQPRTAADAVTPGGARGDAAALVRERMLDTDHPSPLVIYPEGTTTNGMWLTRFHRGAFLAGQPVQPCFLHHSWRTFSPTWESVPFWSHFICNFTQVWQNAELVVLPAYFPSAEERANPALYALNVRRAVSEATGCRESDAYARHKFELHRHIHAGRIDWRWHRNPRSAAELEARLLTPVRPRTDGQEPGDPGKRGREAEGPAISPILPLDRTIGEVAQWDVEEGAARGEGNEAKQGGAGAAPPALTAANCRGGDGEAPTGRGGGGDAEREASVETGATCPGDATRGTVAADAE